MSAKVEWRSEALAAWAMCAVYQIFIVAFVATSRGWWPVFVGVLLFGLLCLKTANLAVSK